MRDLGSIPGLGRSPGEGKSYPLQYFGLENSMDCTVHGVTKSWTQLSNFHFNYPCKTIIILIHLLRSESMHQFIEYMRSFVTLCLSLCIMLAKNFTEIFL